MPFLLFSLKCFGIILFVCLFVVVLLRMSVKAGFTHLPDSGGTQITALNCRPLASK